jgi:hypothetical protein
MYSWSITANRFPARRHTNHGWSGAWDVESSGSLFAFNEMADGWVGFIDVRPRGHYNAAIVANRCKEVKSPEGCLTSDPPGKLAPPSLVRAAAYRDQAVLVAWRDNTTAEIGYRVERSIDGGPWTTIAYRPPQIIVHSENLPIWVDFTVPPARPLRYRVVAINSRDDDRSANVTWAQSSF